jgi:hypothetical protein
MGPVEHYPHQAPGNAGGGNYHHERFPGFVGGFIMLVVTVGIAAAPRQPRD